MSLNSNLATFANSFMLYCVRVGIQKNKRNFKKGYNYY
jgi:hypothetical protein